MSALLTADAILFAIQSGIKLNRNIRKAYARTVVSKSIVLPLPKFTVEPNTEQAITFFNDEDPEVGGARFLKIKRVRDLHQKASDQFTPFIPEEQEEYRDYYVKLKKFRLGEPPTIPYMVEEDLDALLTVQQWEKDDPQGLTPLQLIAATFVEVGIDYFSQVSHRLDGEKPVNKVLKRFLMAFDAITVEQLEKSTFKEVAKEFAPKLFVTTVEAIGDLSEEITNDQKLQLFIEGTTSGIATDLYNKLKKIDKERHDKRDHVINWGQIILYSSIKNAGNYVFSAPADVLNTNHAASELIKSTGLTIMDIILDRPDLDPNTQEPTDEEKIDFSNLFDVHSIDRIMRSAFEVIAEYPEFISKRDGIREIVQGLTATLAKKGINRPNLLPDLLRLVLDNTANNLHLLLKDDGQDGAKHLLVLTLQQTLDILAQEPPDGQWPRLTAPQLLFICQNMVDQVVNNPAWILEKIPSNQGSEEPLLRTVLDAVFNALKNIPSDTRLNVQTIEVIIRTSIRTAALSRQVLKKVKFGTGQEEKYIINHSLDLIFESVFKTDNLGAADRIHLLTDLVDYIFGVVIADHSDPKPKGLILTRLILLNKDIDYSSGFNRELANKLLLIGLKVMEEQPELASDEKALQEIISQMAASLKDTRFDQPGVLFEVIRLAIYYTTKNKTLIQNEDTNNPRYLVVVAINQFLLALTDKDGDSWQPNVSPTEAIQIAENLLDIIVAHPMWVIGDSEDDTLLKEVLSAIFDGLAQIPKGQRLEPQTQELIIRICLQTISNSQKIAKWDPETRKIIREVIKMVFATVFVPSTDGTDKVALVIDLLEYILEVIIARNPNSKGLLLSKIILIDSGIDFSDGFDEEVADELYHICLTILSENPQVVTSEHALQNIISGIARELSATDLDRPYLLLEVIRLSLLKTAGQLDLIIAPGDNGQPKQLLVLVIGHILKAITAPPSADGKWKPSFTDEQMIELIDLILEEAIDNPQWLQDHELILLVLAAIFQALEGIPPIRKIPYQTVKWLIEKSLEAVSFRKNLVLKLASGEQLVLTYSLKSLFIELYDKNQGNAGSWQLTQTPVIQAIIEHLLLGLSQGPITKPEIDKSIKKISDAVEQLNQDTVISLEELLESLSNVSNT